MFVVGLGVLLGPIRRRFQQLDETIVGKEKQLARNLRVLSSASKDAAVSEYKELGNTMPKQGSTAEEASSMLAEIEKQATEVNVVLTATKQIEPKLEKTFEEYQVEIEIEADMKKLVGFLYGVESSVQLLRVERVSLDLKSGGEQGAFRGTLLVSKVVTL
jgi:Tfp pilus assembly protein PilO